MPFKNIQVLESVDALKESEMKSPRISLGLLLLLCGVELTKANLDPPPPGYTGAPGEQTCTKAGCHDVSSGAVGALLLLRTTSNVADTVDYELTLYDRSPDDGVTRWGFQITSLDSVNQPFGELIASDSSRMQVAPGPFGRAYLSQTAAGAISASSAIAWDFRWVRPSASPVTDSVYFYVVGLLADGDGTELNDAIVSAGPSFCPVWPPFGDVNISGAVTSADLIQLVSYVFKGGLQPYPCEAAGDLNCDGKVNSADIISLVNYVFKSGLQPCDVCPLIIDGTWDCS